LSDLRIELDQIDHGAVETVRCDHLRARRLTGFGLAGALDSFTVMPYMKPLGQLRFHRVVEFCRAAVVDRHADVERVLLVIELLGQLDMNSHIPGPDRRNHEDGQGGQHDNRTELREPTHGRPLPVRWM
jgi:hypothetical protein